MDTSMNGIATEAEIKAAEVKAAELKVELEAFQNRAKDKEKKKKRERTALLIFIGIGVAFILGYAIGIQSGYHSALVDFSIIPGSIMAPY